MSTRQIYIENIIEDLVALASLDFQRIGWFDNDQGISSSFADTTSDLFDGNSLIETLYDKKSILINKKVHQTLQELDALTDAIGYDKADTDIISSTEMARVRQKAAEALMHIKTGNNSESTVSFIKTGTAGTPITIQEAFNEVAKGLVAQTLTQDKGLLA